MYSTYIKYSGYCAYTRYILTCEDDEYNSHQYNQSYVSAHSGRKIIFHFRVCKSITTTKRIMETKKKKKIRMWLVCDARVIRILDYKKALMMIILYTL
jgi:hypothetical protein